MKTLNSFYHYPNRLHMLSASEVSLLCWPIIFGSSGEWKIWKRIEKIYFFPLQEIIRNKWGNFSFFVLSSINWNHLSSNLKIHSHQSKASHWFCGFNMSILVRFNRCKFSICWCLTFHRRYYVKFSFNIRPNQFQDINQVARVKNPVELLCFCFQSTLWLWNIER